jgi:putative ABC transport system permease protein
MSRPSWRAYVRSHLPPLDISPEREIEIVDELALQLEAAYDTAINRGATTAEAHQAALAEVPDWHALAKTLAHIERPLVSRVPPAVRPTSGGLMSGLIQDIRYAYRGLVRAPGFATVAILTLTLGIAATTIVYSLVDGILLRPLPIHQPDRVVIARETNPGGVPISLSWPNFLDWQARAKSFQILAVWRGRAANFTGSGDPQRILIREVTWNLFDVLGVQPAAGRGLTAADDAFGVPRVCVISHGFAQRQFGGSSEAIGKQITLDEEPVTIVGVLPADFTIARVEDAFLPLRTFIGPGSSMLGRGNHNGLAAVGRLADGVSLDAARAELAVIAKQLADSYPNTNSGIGAMADLLFDVLVQQTRPALAVLAAAVAVMLLIACVNLANLLLVRGAARAQELEVRRALGAERWRLLRQLLTESVVLSLIGGVAGIVLAYAGFNVFLDLLPADQPRMHQVTMNGRVLLFAVAISVAAGLLFGLVPALHAGSRRAMSLLRGARVAGAAGVQGRTRQLLLVAQLSLALVLLVAAGLMTRTMENLFAIDVGFAPERVVSANLLLPATRYTADARRAFFTQVEERLRAVPGVENAALALSLPVRGSFWNSVFVIEGLPVPARADLPSAALNPVTPGYFDTMGMQLVRGRGFTAADRNGTPYVAVVNESFVKRFWPNGDALGKRLKQGWPEDKTPWREIVGVVKDVKTEGVDQPTRIQVYLPLAQEPFSFVTVVARATGDPARLRSAVERAVREVDPNLPVYDILTLPEIMQRGVGSQRLLMILLLGFGGLALLLAAVGVFGVNAYAVSQRTHELGVRMALGADRGRVLKMVLAQGFVTCAIGIALGIVAAIGATRLLRTLLYQVTPYDPFTFASVTAVLILITAAACYLPALRATRVDPVAALRAG